MSASNIKDTQRIDTRKMANPRSTFCLEIRRLENSMSSFPEKTDAMDKSTIAKVVVLIPPAVELGEPPINMSIIVNNFVDVFISAIGKLLKPAVLGVTE
jgi:hypothetical protein